MATQQRFNVLLDGPTVNVLDEIQAATSLRSRAAVFDLAVNILDWLVDQKRKGMEVGRFNPETGKFDELLIPVAFRLAAQPTPAPVQREQIAASPAQMTA